MPLHIELYYSTALFETRIFYIQSHTIKRVGLYDNYDDKKTKEFPQVKKRKQSDNVWLFAQIITTTTTGGDLQFLISAQAKRGVKPFW